MNDNVESNTKRTRSPLENALMNAIGKAVTNMPREVVEETASAKEILALLAGVDPTKCRGMLVMAVLENPGSSPEKVEVELVQAMTGSPQLLEVLSEGAQAILHAAVLKERIENMRQRDPIGAAVYEILVGDAPITAHDIKDRYKPQGGNH